MRHPSQFSYRMHTLPQVPRVLDFIVEHARLEAREAYGTFNMGAGFALFVAQQDTQAVLDLCQSIGTSALLAGQVEHGPKQVVIEPLGLAYGEEDLNLR